MFKGHTQQQVQDNNRYTQECDKIYHSFRIAEVKRTHVNQSLIVHKHKLKKKVTKGNTVIYKFYNVQGLMIGARHGHCLVVKDGKIQYAVAHYLYKYSSGYHGYSHRNFKHTYSHIDDDSIQIVFSREFLANAKKAKFDLPLPSKNIIYEEDNQANDT